MHVGAPPIPVSPVCDKTHHSVRIKEDSKDLKGVLKVLHKKSVYLEYSFLKPSKL